MRFTFDPAELALSVLAVLLMVGVLPFTPVVVGALILGTMVKLKVTL